MDRLITADLVSRLNALFGFLRSNILGQDEVLSDIVSLLRRSFCGLRFPGRPIASMLFLGPTGVGKTETVNLFTQHLFGSGSREARASRHERIHDNRFYRQSCAGIIKTSEASSVITMISLSAAALCYSTRSKRRIRSSWMCFCRS